MRVRRLAVLVGFTLSISFVSAQQTAPSVTIVKEVQPAASIGVPGSTQVQSLINGVVMTDDEKPLPKATVRIRNLDRNVVEQTVTSNGRGEFSFSVRPQSPYIIEVVGPGGRVVAVGDIVVVNAGEVARAVVTLPSRLPVTGFFGDATLAVISAATSIGLTVADPTLPKVSPTR